MIETQREQGVIKKGEERQERGPEVNRVAKFKTMAHKLAEQGGGGRSSNGSHSNGIGALLGSSISTHNGISEVA